MTESEKYYTEKLYPLQDGILNIVNRLKLPFYLTGGTALSRHYFHHRFSDDLDFFVNADPNFGRYVDAIFSAFEEEQHKGTFRIDTTTIFKRESSAQVFLVGSQGTRLKIDLVNDIAIHYGDFLTDPILGRVDSWRNILSNKISALYRFEPKDIVDLWAIASHYSFSWKELFVEAISKELAVDPISATDILRGMPREYLNAIKWITDVEYAAFSKDIDVIATDILLGNDNTLSPH